jgi:hypothetical protein
MAQGSWEPSGPELRLKIAGLEWIPQFVLVCPLLPTARGSTQAHLRLLPPQLQCGQSTFVVIRSSSQLRVNRFAQPAGKNARPYCRYAGKSL